MTPDMHVTASIFAPPPDEPTVTITVTMPASQARTLRRALVTTRVTLLDGYPYGECVRTAQRFVDQVYVELLKLRTGTH